MKIDLYDNNIKVPSAAEQKEMGKIAHMIYATPKVASVIEYAGRTCYQSFDKITENSYGKFIGSIVKMGHESVIEHSNLVFVIFKENGKPLGLDSNQINRHLINLMMWNGLLEVSECQAYFLISGNLRMFKDLCRKYLAIKSVSNKENKIVDDIINELYQLPPYFFIDMINNGMMEESRFKINTRYIDHDNNLVFKKLNDYLTVISQDAFNFKVRGFLVKDTNGNIITKKISTPTNILKKHNRITIKINAPRFITHQIVRHRVFSYSQRSQRYVLESGINVWIPESIKQAGLEGLMDFGIKNAYQSYQQLIANKIKKEDARAVLPESAMSVIIMTGTVDQFQQFVALRSSDSAQNMVRDYIARPLKAYLEEYYQKSTDDVTPEYKKNSAMINVTTTTKLPKKKKNVVKKQIDQKKKTIRSEKPKNPFQPQKSQKRPHYNYNSGNNNVKKNIPRIDEIIQKKKTNNNNNTNNNKYYRRKEY